MAGDWIPIRTDLSDHPKTLRIAQQLRKSTDEVVGLLVRFWSWVQQHTDSGRLEGITVELAALGAKVPARFLEVLVDVDWLVVADPDLLIPEFPRWFSGAAKRRLRDAARKRAVRKMSTSCPQNVRKMSAQMRTIGEERRGKEKKKVPPDGGSRLGSRPPPAESPTNSQIDQAVGTPESPGLREMSAQSQEAAAVARAIERLTAAWNALEGVPAIRSWSESRRRQIRVRLRDPTWLDQALEAVRRISDIPFLCGQNDRGWRANIDWLLRPDSVTKILEGQYKGAAHGRRQTDNAARYRHESGRPVEAL